MKGQYRTFNIKSATLTPGDDYAMMREVLTRRFARLKREGAAPRQDERVSRQARSRASSTAGAGSSRRRGEMFAELGVEGVRLASIAKGPDRNAGRETFFVEGREPFKLPPRDPALFFVQRLRDEAHRFAIGTHRAKRKKEFVKSPLDEIPGIGPARKRALLHAFGTAKDGRARGAGGSRKDAGPQRGDGAAGLCVLSRGRQALRPRASWPDARRPAAQQRAHMMRLVVDETRARAVADLDRRELRAGGSGLDRLRDRSAAGPAAARPGWSKSISASSPTRTTLRELVAAAAGEDGGGAVEFGRSREADWVANALAGLAPVRAGRFLVHGAHDRARVRANDIGSRSRPASPSAPAITAPPAAACCISTALLKRRRPRTSSTSAAAPACSPSPRRRRCGGKVWLGDIDPVAVAVANANARLNGVGACLQADRLARRRDARLARGRALRPRLRQYSGASRCACSPPRSPRSSRRMARRSSRACSPPTCRACSRPGARRGCSWWSGWSWRDGRACCCGAAAPGSPVAASSDRAGRGRALIAWTRPGDPRRGRCRP